MVDRARFVISGGVPTREALRVHALDFVLVSYRTVARISRARTKSVHRRRKLFHRRCLGSGTRPRIRQFNKKHTLTPPATTANPAPWRAPPSAARSRRGSAAA